MTFKLKFQFRGYGEKGYFWAEIERFRFKAKEEFLILRFACGTNRKVHQKHFYKELKKTIDK